MSKGQNRNQLDWVHRGSQRLKWQWQSWSLSGSVLGSLHRCYGCVVWNSSRTPSVGVGVVSESFECTWDSLFATGLPHSALMWEFVLSLIITFYSMFIWYSWEAWSFLKGKGGGMDMGYRGDGWRGLDGMERGETTVGIRIWENRTSTVITREYITIIVQLSYRNRSSIFQNSWSIIKRH